MQVEESVGVDCAEGSAGEVAFKSAEDNEEWADEEERSEALVDELGEEEELFDVSLSPLPSFWQEVVYNPGTRANVAMIGGKGWWKRVQRVPNMARVYASGESADAVSARRKSAEEAADACDDGAERAEECLRNLASTPPSFSCILPLVRLYRTPAKP